MEKKKLSNKKIPLIERITVCGIPFNEIHPFLSNSRNKLEQLNTLKAKILEDYKSDLVPDDNQYNKYSFNIPSFSLPQGILLNSFHNSLSYQIISFTLQNDAKPKHCSSLSFYENCLYDSHKFSILKSITLVSSKQLYSTHNKFLEFIYEVIKNYHTNKRKNIKDLYSFYSDDLKQSINQYNILEFYFSFLLNGIDISQNSLADYNSFCLLDLPIPKRVLSHSHIAPLLTFNIDNKSPFPINDINISILFDKFHIEDIIKIYQSLLLEYKIIFVFENYEEINLIIFAFLSLIYPLKWKFPIYSYILPKSEMILDAPFAVIIGIHQKYRKDINFKINKHSFSKETIIYDLKERNFILLGNIYELPIKTLNELRSSLYFTLSERRKLKIVKDEMNKQLVDEEGLMTMFNMNNEILKTFNTSKIITMIKSDLYFNLRIISIFFNVFIKMIKGFEKFITYKTGDNNNIDLKECPIEDIYDFNKLNENFRKENILLKEQYYLFFNNFTKSLMFNNFIRNYICKGNKKQEYIFITEIFKYMAKKESNTKNEIKELFREKIKTKIMNYYKVSNYSI